MPWEHSWNFILILTHWKGTHTAPQHWTALKRETKKTLLRRWTKIHTHLPWKWKKNQFLRGHSLAQAFLHFEISAWSNCLLTHFKISVWKWDCLVAPLCQLKDSTETKNSHRLVLCERNYHLWPEDIKDKCMRNSFLFWYQMQLRYGCQSRGGENGSPIKPFVMFECINFLQVF